MCEYPITVLWESTSSGDNTWILDVHAEILPYERVGWYDAAVGLSTDKQKQAWFNGGELILKERVRNTGMDTHLMMAVVALVKAYGVIEYTDYVLSPSEMMTYQKMFGENIRFFESDAPYNELSINTDRALGALNWRESASQRSGVPAQGFYIEADLRDIDTTGWELPIELNKPTQS